MSAIHVEIDVPGDLARFRLPSGVQHRLQALLDKQDQGVALSNDERDEAEGAEGLVNLSELLSLLRLRAERLGGSSHAG
jgi:hypothetical protein